MTATDFADAVERIRPSVVQIVARETPLSGLGSGFFVSMTGHVATACHVVGAHQGDLAIRIPFPNSVDIRENFVMAHARVVAEDRDCDVALLRTDANPFAAELPGLGDTPSGAGVRVRVRVATIMRDRPRDGAAIGIAGFPLDQPVLITTTGVVSSAWKLGHELALPGRPQTRLAMDAWIVDAVANAGNSGGPVFLTDGRVIGVCVAALPASVLVGNRSDATAKLGNDLPTYASGLSLISPAGYLAQLMWKNGLDVIEETTP